MKIENPDATLGSEGAIHYVDKPFHGNTPESTPSIHAGGIGKCPSCGAELYRSRKGAYDICSVCYYNVVVKKSVNENLIEESFRGVVEEAFSLWQKKHLSYGPYNISVFGIKGIAVRLWDKMQRVVRLGWNNVENPLEETLIDTFLDIAVYALIAILVIRNQWPKSPFEVKV